MVGLVFILEGLLSVLLGVLCFFALPDSPKRAKWLKPDEAKFLELSHIAFRGVRVSDKKGEGKEKRKINWSIIKQIVTDWQIYLQGIIFWSNTVCLPTVSAKVPC